MRVLFVAGSPRRASKTRILVQRAKEYAERAHPDVETDILDVRSEAPAPFRGFDEEYPDETHELLARAASADALVLGSPVFNGSYSAALKNLFEHIDHKSLKGRVAGFVLVAGGEKSFLQVRSALEQLMTYFQVHVVPEAAYAEGEDVDEDVPEAVERRLERLVDAVVETRRALVEGGRAEAVEAR